VSTSSTDGLDPLLGRLVAQKYRLSKLLGQGGIGRVYLAEQTNLGRQVALKVLHAHLNREAQIARRFYREAKSASMLSHPNLLQILDFGNDDGLLFIVMELIKGRDLGHVLRDEWPLSPSRIAHIGAQILSALTETHRAGIVHRDLKPANVMLLDAGGEPDFVKVCDFGLAKVVTKRGNKGSSLTEAGATCGTPEFMSPEQARGDSLDGRSDLYAVAVILYNLLVGDVPFRAETSMGVLLRHLHDAPQPPSQRQADIVPGLEAVIMKGLAKSPADRFASASEMRRALLHSVGIETPHDRALASAEAQTHPRTVHSVSDGVTTAIGFAWRRAAAASSAGRSWRRWGGAAGLAALLVAAVAGGWWLRRRAAGATSAAQAARRAVAVLGFKNLSGPRDAAWLSTALSEMLTTELGQSGQLRTLSGEDVARAKTELHLLEADSLARESLAQIRRNLDADLVVLGSYTAIGGQTGQLRIDLRVQDTKLGETVALVAEVGSQAELFDVVGRLGQRLRQQLGVAAGSDADEHAVRATLPAQLAAARAYAEGLARLRVGDALAARDLLEKALAIAPNHAPSHMALAQAWSFLGYDARAREESARALALAAPLPREQRLAIEAFRYVTTNNWTKAADVYGMLFDFFPDNLDYGLQLADAQHNIPKFKEALATLDRLRALPEPQRNDPRIDLERAYSLRESGENRQAIAAAEAAQHAAHARGAELIEGRALRWKAGALWRLGECEQAISVAEQAKAIFTRLGDRRDMARAMNLLGICYDERGDHAKAMHAFDEMLAVAQDIGDRVGIRTALTSRAAGLADFGHRKEALVLFERALAISRETQQLNYIAFAQADIAILHFNLGEATTARREMLEAITAARKTESRTDVASWLLNEAHFEEALGNLEGAREQLEQGRAIARETGERNEEADASVREASLWRKADKLDEARRALDEAIRLYHQIGKDPDAEDARIDEAEREIDEGNLAGAEALAAQALAALQPRPSNGDIVSHAHAVLARALVEERKIKAARGEIDQAVVTLPPEPKFEYRMQLEITQARVEAGEGHEAKAKRRLEGALAECRRVRFRDLELQARLAQLQISSQRKGNPGARALRAEATRQGFLLVARRAAELGG
jgi:tetratricopeptide (TPR) repeat protein